MASIIEGANSAYEERDKATEQIENMKQQAKRDEGAMSRGATGGLWEEGVGMEKQREVD